MLDYTKPLKFLNYQQRFSPEAQLARYQRSFGIDDDPPQVEPEEQNAILGRVMGTLETLGNVLDTPRAMAWEAAQLKNPFAVANPFDRETVAKRTTGWDLLKGLGIEGQEGFDWTDIPAVATEIALDPLIAVRGPWAALTKKGKAAGLKAGPKNLKEGVQLAKQAVKGELTAGKTLGEVPSAMARELRSGERTLGALAVPFTDKRWNFNFGLGAKRAGDLWEKANFGRFSPVPLVREVLSPVVGGVPVTWASKEGRHLDALPQLQHDLAYANMRDYLNIRDEIAPLLQDWVEKHQPIWDKVGEHARTAGGEKFGDIQDFVRYISEQRAANLTKIDARGRFKTIDPKEIETLFQQGGDQAAIELLAKDAYEFADSIKQIDDAAYDMIYRYGGKNEILGSLFGEHGAPRHGTKIGLPGAKAREMQFIKTTIPEAHHQEAILKMPGNTKMAQFLSKNELYTGTDNLADNVLSGTPSAAATRKGIVQNAVVFAEDRGNYGRVMGVDGNDATVFFKNPETGATETVNLPIKQLKAATPDAKLAALVPPARTIRTPAELQQAVINEAGALGITVTDPITNLPRDLTDIRGEIIWKKHLKQELDANVERHLAGIGPADVKTRTKVLKDADQASMDWVGEHYAPLPGSLAEAEAQAANVMFDATAKSEAPLGRSLAEYLARQDDIIRNKGIFGRGLVEDWMTYQKHAAVALANLASAHALIGRFANINVAGVPPDQLKGSVTLAAAWDMATVPQKVTINGRTVTKQVPALNDEGLLTFVQKFAAEHANDPNLSKLGTPQDLADLAGASHAKQLAAAKKLAANMTVDDRLPDVLSKYIEVNGPDMRTWLGQKYDQWNTIIRKGLTKYWPGFHFRNDVDGSYRNFMRAGENTYGLGQYFTAEKNAMKLSLNWSEKSADKLIQSIPFGKEFLAQSRGPLGAAPLSEMGETAAREKIVGSLKQLFTGTAEETLQPAKTIPGKIWRGIENVTDRAYAWIEFKNRYVPFAAAMANGKSAGQAWALANDIQYTYGKRMGGALPGAWGRTTMPRIVPFWSFLSQNIPYQFKQLMALPGGGQAQTIRAFGRMREGESGYVPGWMREQTAIRMGGEDAAANFIRSFGLSLEQLGIPVWTEGPMGLKTPFNLRTLQKFASQAGPQVQLLLKLLTGKDLYTGRPLKEMEGPLAKLGLPPILDTLAQSSPASRVASTAFMLSHPDKSWLIKAIDYITGVKIGTYNLPKQKTYETEAATNALLEQMPDVRQFTRSYIPASRKAAANPKAIRLLGLLNALERQRLA